MPADSLVYEDLDNLISTAEAAELTLRAPVTIRQWKHKNLLQPAGLDEQGRPLYRMIDVLRLERRFRNRTRTTQTAE